MGHNKEKIISREIIITYLQMNKNTWSKLPSKKGMMEQANRIAYSICFWTQLFSLYFLKPPSHQDYAHHRTTIHASTFWSSMVKEWSITVFGGCPCVLTPFSLRPTSFPPTLYHAQHHVLTMLVLRPLCLHHDQSDCIACKQRFYCV